MVESGQKVIVFAHHIDILNELSEKIPFSVSLMGDDSTTKRQAAVDNFQDDASVRVMVSSLRAGGSGYTMTAAGAVVFAELDWTPSVITQAEDRAHRKGQQGNVLVQHLVLSGSLDARMAKVCIEKQSVIDEVVDGKTGQAQ
jgi:SWI/SNF-related matrix-associated actin-dependent regulator 1 of chromatin subfamily A